jgi:hypothetical protein
MGEKKNCMAAKTVPKRPSILAALEVSPCRKLSMRRGSTGTIIPSASISSVTVRKIKVAAARRPLRGSGERAVSGTTSSCSNIMGLGGAICPAICSRELEVTSAMSD